VQGGQAAQGESAAQGGQAGQGELAVQADPVAQEELAARGGLAGQGELAVQAGQTAAGKRPIVRPRVQLPDPAAAVRWEGQMSAGPEARQWAVSEWAGPTPPSPIAAR
jgi:hypothetical protein